MNSLKFSIFTFYQFKKLSNLENIKHQLRDICSFNKIKGTILIANEGINGTISGSYQSINIIQNELINLGFKNLEKKISFYKYMPFNYLKVKIKKEIVTMFETKLKIKNTAKHVKPEDWNKLIDCKDIILLDVRNNFEHKMGSFIKSLNPQTKKFSEFKKFVNKKLSKYNNKKIAMFCTGGIRCEKASSYMLNKGYKKLYQLKGGILNYLEKIPEKNSLWKGECFVFDNRISVKNELKEGTYELCHGCRMPLSKKDLISPKYKNGISCNYCFDNLSNEKKKRLEERNKQIRIAKKKGLYNPYIKHTTSDFY